MDKSNIDRTRSEIISLLDRLTKEREKYKELVNKLYEKENPFPQDRRHSEDNFGYDIEKFEHLIGHSVIAGDAEILKRWGIDPLIKQELSLSQDNLKYYYDFYTESDRLKKITTEFEKALIEKLADALKTRL